MIALCSILLSTTACKSQQEATSETAEETKTETVRKGPKQGNPEQRAARLEEMMTTLGLSADQKVKFKAIDSKYADKMRALRDAGDRDAMREGMRSIQTEKSAELKGILTVDQMTKYKEMMEARKPKGGRPGR